MSGKKLLSLLIVPAFAVGMAACQVEDEPDFYIEETQVPADEPVIIEEEPADTVIVPDEPIEEDETVETETPRY